MSNSGKRLRSDQQKEGTGPSMTAGPIPQCLLQHLPLSNDRRGRRRSFSFADAERPTSVLRTASDAKESQCRCRE
jgi:hypothetical protein